MRALSIRARASGEFQPPVVSRTRLGRIPDRGEGSEDDGVGRTAIATRMIRNRAERIRSIAIIGLLILPGEERVPDRRLVITRMPAQCGLSLLYVGCTLT